MHDSNLETQAITPKFKEKLWVGGGASQDKDDAVDLYADEIDK